MSCNWKKKKWYNWTTGHCWHLVDGSEKKLKYSCRDACNYADDQYIVWNEDFAGPFIYIRKDVKCCWCNKFSTTKLRDFDISRASNYPDGGNS